MIVAIQRGGKERGRGTDPHLSRARRPCKHRCRSTSIPKDRGAFRANARVATALQLRADPNWTPRGRLQQAVRGNAASGKQRALDRVFRPAALRSAHTHLPPASTRSVPLREDRAGDKWAVYAPNGPAI